MAAFKLSYKLILGYLAIILLSGLVSVYTHQMETAHKDEIIRNIGLLQASERLETYNARVVVAAQSVALSHTDYEQRRSASMFSDAYGSLNTQIAILEASGVDKYSLRILRTYMEIIKSDFEKLMLIHAGAHMQNDSAGTKSEELEILKSIGDANVKLAGAREMIVEQVNNKQKDSVAKAEKQELLSQNILLAEILLGVALSIYITRNVTAQITQLRDGARKIGAGDLKITLDASSGDEIGELAGAFNSMAENLRKSTISIKELDVAVAKKTKELALKNEEHERFNRLSVGRELKMIELKKKISELEAQIAGKK